MVRLFTVLSFLVVGACVTESLPAGHTISVGTSDDGYLRDARALPNRGVGYERLRPNDDTRYGTTTLLDAIQRAAKSVEESFPGGPPLRIGDLSRPRGGSHPRHRSHRSGRDADLLFFARDAGGLPVVNAGWPSFDSLGQSRTPAAVVWFDEARNWHLVRSLVMDEHARVKWIFCSNELKARLLRYAVRHEPSADAVLRATWILHQPSHGDDHDDHFHVRVGCSRAERQLGCREDPPHWPWLSDPARKGDHGARAAAGDAQLVEWLLAEEHVYERSNVFGSRFDVAAKPALATHR
jgi:penicillin-insensitive murein endopeptidase